MAEFVILWVALVAALRFTWDYLVWPVIETFIGLHTHFKGPPDHFQQNDDVEPRVGFHLPTRHYDDEEEPWE